MNCYSLVHIINQTFESKFGSAACYHGKYMAITSNRCMHLLKLKQHYCMLCNTGVCTTLYKAGGSSRAARPIALPHLELSHHMT